MSTLFIRTIWGKSSVLQLDRHLAIRRVLLKKTEPRFVPCTALGCIQLLKRNHIDISNKIAVVVGDSNYVGIPLSVLLRKENAAIVSVCHGISYKE